jgi:hypothetical protein
MTEIRNNPVWVIRNWNLDIVWDLVFACLPRPRPIDSAGLGPVGREIGASAASPTFCSIFCINLLVRDYA